MPNLSDVLGNGFHSSNFEKKKKLFENKIRQLKCVKIVKRYSIFGGESDNDARQHARYIQYHSEGKGYHCCYAMENRNVR